MIQPDSFPEISPALAARVLAASAAAGDPTAKTSAPAEAVGSGPVGGAAVVAAPPTSTTGGKR